MPREPRTYWDGVTWGRAYWTWWRRGLTGALAVVGVLLFFGALPATLGDPGPGGTSDEFERTKTIGASLEFVAMFGIPLLLALLNVQIIRADRAWKLAAQAARQPV